MAKDIILFETSYWKVILFEDQSYLGRCVILLKRNCGELSSLTFKEWSDFSENIVKKMEIVLKKSFNSTMFNWTCLMNDAYKDKYPKPQVHWHFRPRYKSKVTFEGEIFEDSEFAHHYSRERKKIVSNEILEKIAKKIKENF